MGLTLGAGGTAIGNAMWGKFDHSVLGDINVGYWTICKDPIVGDNECKNTYDQDLFTENGRTFKHNTSL